MVPLVAENPDVDEILSMDEFEDPSTSVPRRLAARVVFHARVRAARFDWAIDLHGGPRSAFVTWASGAPLRVGYDTPGRRYAYTLRLPRFVTDADGKQVVRSAVRVNASLVEPLDVAVRDESLVLGVPAAARSRARAFLDGARLGAERPLVLVNPAAKWATKAWPADRYGRLAGRLAVERGADVVILWGPGERATAEAVRATAHAVFARAEAARAAARHERVRLAPEGDLGDVAALVECARLVVGTDSGVSHIAAALGTPSVTLFGPTNPTEWHPYDPTRHRAIFHGVPCSFCNLTACAWHACMNELSEDRVFAACRESLDAGTPSARPAGHAGAPGARQRRPAGKIAFARDARPDITGGRSGLGDAI